MKRPRANWRQLAEERPDYLNARMILFDLAAQAILDADKRETRPGGCTGSKASY